MNKFSVYNKILEECYRFIIKRMWKAGFGRTWMKNLIDNLPL